MAGNKKACEDDAVTPSRAMPEVYYPLHSLLHTLRQLEQHEDQLCTLLTELQRTGKVTARVRSELSAFLTSFPAASLEQEVRAIFYALDEAA